MPFAKNFFIIFTLTPIWIGSREYKNGHTFFIPVSHEKKLKIFCVVFGDLSHSYFWSLNLTNVSKFFRRNYLSVKQATANIKQTLAGDSKKNTSLRRSLYFCQRKRLIMISLINRSQLMTENKLKLSISNSLHISAKI